ncbi:helix-turn-helix domain-containing protein [Flocculibacter collagenilyticus]|uniref:helix-turn-helix domain-containing protein n=1 Tax=Flocculibacter collagenilyticus TaxID=2744479 RepID=UPI0018F456C7|nr:helix-turn-helix domain-containing protein [Flocculibacter collagenilyticus]
MNNKTELTIREVSIQCGIPTPTLRFYEEKGLISSIGRKGITRVFKSSVIEQLSLISLARYAGFALDEIAGMFSPNGTPTINRDQLLTKAEHLERKIQQLSAMRDGLRHVANCPEENQLTCPKFQALVTKAAKAQLLEDKRRHLNKSAK